MTLKSDLRLSAKLFVLIIVVALVPVVVLDLLDLETIASLAVLGALTGLTAMIVGGWDTAARTGLATGAAAGAASLLSGHALVAALAFVVIGLFMGGTRTVSHWMAYTMLPITAGFALTTQPAVADSPVVNALLIAGAIIGAALFGGGIGMFAFRGLPKRTSPTLVPVHALTFGLLLGVLLGIATFITVHFDLGHTGSWVILTTSIVFQPYIQDGVKMAIQRAAGTVGGFLIAIVVGLTISNTTVIEVVALVAAFVMVLMKVQNRPYWEYAMALTVTVVLLEGASGSVVRTDDDRLLASVTAIVIVVTVIALISPAVKHFAEKHGAAHY